MPVRIVPIVADARDALRDAVEELQDRRQQIITVHRDGDAWLIVTSTDPLPARGKSQVETR